MPSKKKGFYIQTITGEFVYMPNAAPVKHPLHPDGTFFSYKGTEGYYCICDAKTGLSITGFWPKLKDANERLQELLQTLPHPLNWYHDQHEIAPAA